MINDQCCCLREARAFDLCALCGSTNTLTTLLVINRAPSNPSVLCAAFQLKERVSLRKQEDERLALRSQMSVDEDERRRIEDIKAEEKEQAEV